MSHNVYQFYSFKTKKRTTALSLCAFDSLKLALGGKEANKAVYGNPHQSPFKPSKTNPGWNKSILTGVGITFQKEIK